MSNIRDWCISRQIWWGHRIPAGPAPSVALQPSAGKTRLPVPIAAGRPGPGNRRPGHLVLFGPVALLYLGWPTETPELKLFYPTSVLVTAFDILFFWVARMMMMGFTSWGKSPSGRSTSTPWCGTRKARK